MKSYLFIFILLTSFCNSSLNAQENFIPDFTWGNTHYINLNIGESVFFNKQEIKLLHQENSFNQLKVGEDTLWLKVSELNLPIIAKNLRLFVSDNKMTKHISQNKKLNSLLSKDILLAISSLNKPMLDPNQFVFPVSFSNGFLWNYEEHNPILSFKNEKGSFQSSEGVKIDLHNAEGKQKNWSVAIENSSVIWVEYKKLKKRGKQACVLLKSDANPEIYYVYNCLQKKSLKLKKGQKLKRGELVGMANEDKGHSYFQFLVIKSEKTPNYKNCFTGVLNFFPHLFELYVRQSYPFIQSFSRGKIEFGRLTKSAQVEKNTFAFEEYIGRGWLLDKWNKLGRVEAAPRGTIRLRKVLFANTNATSKNPRGYYDYEINVKNGVYRVRAKVGDLYLPSWQNIYFEGVNAGILSLKAMQQKWTSEKIVKVNDRKLTIRIYINSKEAAIPAALSQVVFQRVY